MNTMRNRAGAGLLAISLFFSCGRDTARAPVREPQPSAKVEPSQTPPTRAAPRAADTLAGLLQDSVGAFLDSLFVKSEGISDLAGRVDFFSGALLGRPYGAVDPTGDGPGHPPDTALPWNFQSFDCVTYVEHVLALALSGRTGEFIPILVSLRYRGGHVGYAGRNHFFLADWLANNAGRVRILAPPAGVAVTRTVLRQSFMSRRGIHADLPDTTISMRMWGAAELAVELQERRVAPGAYIIAFVKKGYRFLDANHVALVIVRGSGVVMRDASRMRGTTAERDPRAYLKSQDAFLDGLVVAKVVQPAGDGF